MTFVNKILIFIKRFLLLEIFKGLFLTLKHFFMPKVTIQFPKKKPHKVQGLEDYML